MTQKPFNGKGSNYRPTQISKEENDLRWELIKASPERKTEIIQRLEEIKQEKLNS